MEQAGSSFSSDQDSAELELMRLVIKCIRPSSLVSPAPGPALEAAVCRIIALQARQRYQAVYKLWNDLRAASLRKLRAHLARGDMSATYQRLSTLEWAVVDLLLLYDSSLNVASFFHPAQLAALDRTFSLVQVLHLEPENGREVSPDQWSQAADRYSRNGVMLSAVALQRRWHEMKQHARRRLGFPATQSVHHAIVHRYPHVANDELPSWRGLVTAGMVAEPTAVPSPRPEPALQCKPIQGKSEARQRHSSVAARKKAETDDRLGKKDDVHDKSKDEPITAPDQALVSYNNTDKYHCDNTDNIQQSKKIGRKEIDKTDIKVKPEITEIDDDTPNPKADIVEAMQDMDFNNVDAMIVYESDEDVKTIFDVQMGNADKNADIVGNEENNENVKSRNKKVGQSKYKIFTDCVIERYIDCDNVTSSSFKQNEDDSLKTTKANDNNNQRKDDPKENSMNIVISQVWSERDITPTCDVQKGLHNVTENVSNDNSDNDSDAISVGNDVDYYSHYYDIILAKYLMFSNLDLKLLKRPVVSLQRIDLKSINNSPPTHKPQKTMRSSTQLFSEKNKALLKQCKACEVSLTRVDRKGRKTRKVKLPDIEKVRQNNQGILTAEVAPLVAAPPKVIRQYGPSRTKRLQNTAVIDQSLKLTKPVLGSSESTILQNADKTHALSTLCQDSLSDQQHQHELINHSPDNLQSQDGNLLENCQSNIENGGQARNLNVSFNSISNPMLQMSENWLEASKIQNVQDKITQNMSTNNLETQDRSLNMPDTCRASTVTPTTLTSKSAPAPKHSVPIPIPPIKLPKPVPTPKLPVLIPNPPIRIPKPRSKPIPTVPLPIPPVKLPKLELTPKQSVPIPIPLTKLPKPVPTPKLPVLIPNPPIRIPKPRSEPIPTVPLPIPPVKLPKLELTPEPSTPIPNLQTLTPKPLPTPKPSVPPNPPTLTPKLEPFAPVQYPPEMLTPKLEPTPVPDQPITSTPKSEPTAEPFAPIPNSRSILKPNLEPAWDPSAPIPNLSTVLTPKLEPMSEPFTSIERNSTDLDSICALYSDNYSPMSIVDVNEFNPFRFTPDSRILQTSTLLNPTLNVFLEPSTHAESTTIQVSLTQSASIPNKPTSPELTSKPSLKSYVKKSTKKPYKKKPIKPYIFEFALKQSGDQVILKPLSTKKTPNKKIKAPSTYTLSLPFAPKESRKQVTEKGPWRMEYESFDQSEFDMDMTFAEAYHLYGESDTTFERSVPLLNLL